MRCLLPALSTFLRLPALVCLCLVASAAHASNPAADARETLKQSLDNVFAMLADPEYQNPANREVMFERVEDIVESIFDYEEFSARTVGRRWHSFTPDQQERFTAAFADLLRATYIERIRGYEGKGAQYVGERMSAKGDKVEVQTLLDLDGKSIPIDYRMAIKEKWIIYDVIVEGVSLVKNYRTQFQELLSDKDDAETLITRVANRAGEIRSQNNATK